MNNAQKNALETLLTVAERLDRSFVVTLAQAEHGSGFDAGCSWDEEAWESATEVLWVFLHEGREEACRFLSNL